MEEKGKSKQEETSERSSSADRTAKASIEEREKQGHDMNTKDSRLEALKGFKMVHQAKLRENTLQKKQEKVRKTSSKVMMQDSKLKDSNMPAKGSSTPTLDSGTAREDSGKPIKDSNYTYGKKQKEQENQSQSQSQLRQGPKLKTTKEPDDIFGFLSKLLSEEQDIFKKGEDSVITDSETEQEVQDGEKDMTWLLQLSSSEETKENTPGHFESTIDDRTEECTWLFWLFLLIGGRMPFHFVKSSDPANPEITCRLSRGRHNFYAFVISSLILIFVTAVSMLNLFLIIVEEERKGHPNNQLEKLLLWKNLPSAVITLTSMILASIASINVLIHGDSIAEYITLWIKTLDEFNSKSTSGIMTMTVTIIYVVWIVSLFVLKVVTFYVTIFDSDLNPFIETNHLMTAIVFRSFVPNMLIEINKESGIESSTHLWKYGFFIVCLSTYVFYSSLNFVIMVVICSNGITSMASEWNFRLRLILRQINVKRNEKVLKALGLSLNYENMFGLHRKIVLLIQETSGIFCTLLFAFYSAVAFTLASEANDVSILLIGREKYNFNLNETEKIYDFEKSNRHYLYLGYHLCETIAIFLFVSLFLAQVGRETMSAQDSLIKHNYMNIKSSGRRNFFISLRMSFTAEKPHLLGVGGIFSIDRAFITAFLVAIIYFFSVMLETRHEKILSLPIVFECPPGSNQFCIENKLLRDSEVADLNNHNAHMADRFHNAKGPSTSTTMKSMSLTTTIGTTPKTSVLVPDICILKVGDGRPIAAGINIEEKIAKTPSGTIAKKYPDDCLVTKNLGVRVPYPFLGNGYDDLYDSIDGSVGLGDKRRDSCLNLPFLHEVTKVNAKQIAVKIESNGVFYVLCCYDYGYSNGQAKYCNQRTVDAIDLACGIDQNDRKKQPFRFNDLNPVIQNCLNNGACQIADDCFCGATPTFIVPTVVNLGTINCP